MLKDLSDALHRLEEAVLQHDPIQTNKAAAEYVRLYRQCWPNRG